MMMPLVRIEVSGRIARIVRPIAIVRTVDMAVTGCIAPVRPIALMRSDGPGVKAGQDHRKEAEKGDKRTHAVLNSVGHARGIVRADALAEFGRPHHRLAP